MKVITTIFLILLHFVVLSQTTIDSLVLNKINKYRVSKSVSKVKFSNVNFNAANHHTKYLLSSSVVTHLEDTLKTVRDRVVFYGENPTKIGENIVFFTKNLRSTDNFEDQISTQIVEFWIKSPEHNKILLNKEFSFAGTSTIFESKSVNVKNWINVKVTSTLVMSD